MLLFRLFWHLRTSGLRATARKLAGRFRVRFRPAAAVARRAAGRAGENLGLEAGDLVEVKPLPDIRRTLDRAGTLGGLAFLPGMETYCGMRFRVYKPVRRIFLEESKQLRTLRNTVLLEGVVCDGAGLACDRSCFYYWREAWLTRINA